MVASKVEAPTSSSRPRSKVAIAQLLALEDCRARHGSPLPPECNNVTTPLIVSKWEEALKHYPERAFADYVIRGLSQGFRIGFNYKVVCRSARTNMKSAELHKEPVRILTKFGDTPRSYGGPSSC